MYFDILNTTMLYMMLMTFSSYFYISSHNLLSSIVVDRSKSLKLISTFHATNTVIVNYMFLNDYIGIYYYIPLFFFNTFGYFILDMINIYLFKSNYTLTNLISYVLHHIIAILSLFYIRSYPLTIARCFLSEITTPFLNYSWYLNNNNNSSGIKYIVNCAFLYVFFFYFRVYNIVNVLLYQREGEKDIRYDISLIILLLLNSYWFKKINVIIFKNFYK